MPTRRIIFVGFLILIGGYGIYIFSEQSGFERNALISPVPERLVENEPAVELSPVDEEKPKQKMTTDSLSDRSLKELSEQNVVRIDRTRSLVMEKVIESNVSEMDNVEKEIVVQSGLSINSDNLLISHPDEDLGFVEKNQGTMTTDENHPQQLNYSETRQLIDVRKEVRGEKEKVEPLDLKVIGQEKEKRGRMLTNHSTSIASSAEITIISKADSWVEIVSAGGRVLVSRVFYSGDRFNLPDETGMFLTTGNAGALSIAIGDSVLESLGLTGEVLRDFSLDPKFLIERKLYSNSEGNP